MPPARVLFTADLLATRLFPGAIVKVVGAGVEDETGHVFFDLVGEDIPEGADRVMVNIRVELLHATFEAVSERAIDGA